jgi:hypothetical protein
VAPVIVAPAPEPVAAQAQAPSGNGHRPAETDVTPVIPAAVAARRLSASELLAGKAKLVSTPVQPTPQATPRRELKPVPPRVMEGVEPEEPVAAEVRQPTSAGQPNEKYRLIFLLASEGMDPANIAKHTNLTRGEVEMLLDLRRQGKL